MKPEEWNNVPRIIYEAMFIIVNTLDKNNVNSKQKHKAIEDKFESTHALIG